MSDLTAYAKKRARHDPDFAEGLESGYATFKVGVLLRRARERAGLTQEEVAQRLDSKKSAISRIENRAGDIRLSTLEKYATAIGWNGDTDRLRDLPFPFHGLTSMQRSRTVPREGGSAEWSPHLE